MLRLHIERSINVIGYCEILLNHPHVDVHQFAISWKPDYTEPTSVLTALVCMRLEADPLMENLLFELSLTVDRLHFLGASKLRGINAQQPDADFWQMDSKAGHYRQVNGIAVRHFCDLGEELMRVRPSLQFIGQIWIQAS